ncbi:MAG: penicillin-binding protein activator LpoB [Planctomycetes bacterium]|nr:penicillin-binding protein activator LpoB [Planctomycetota bacterium]MDA0947820.1 penicillin-binding protein activator LpoB [Planctomycetota bacterium]
MKQLLILPLFLAAACSSTSYGDAGATETVTVAWGSTDLQTFSGEMVESLTEAPGLAYLDHSGKGADKRIVLYFGGIENLTGEHVDLGGLRDKMTASLVGKGKFRIVAEVAGQDEIEQQVRFQQGSGRVDPAQAKAFGKQLGADVVLFGALRDITKEKGRSLETAGVKTKDVYFQLVLQMANIETGEIIWAQEGEIRKSQKTGIFG